MWSKIIFTVAALVIGVGLVVLVRSGIERRETALLGSPIFMGADPSPTTSAEPAFDLPWSQPTPSPSPLPQLLTPPSAKFLSDGTHVFQTFNNCGPASLSMALSHLGIRVAQGELGQSLRPWQNPQGNNDDKSVTLIELAQKAEEFGLVAYSRPAGNVELVKQFLAYDIPVITRTWLKPGEDIGHFRVIVGYDETTREFIQDDSLQGNDLRYRYEEFLNLWEAFNHEFLVIVPPEKRVIAEQILGELLDERRAWELALASADQLAAAEPNNVYAQFNRSVAWYHLGNDQQSIRAFEQVESRLPNRMLWYQLEPILAYYRTGQYDRVLSMSQHIFDSQNRSYAELYYVRGLIFQQRGETVAAQNAFAQADRFNSSRYWKSNIDLEGAL
jgi:tetratricopeptide (TPR) repeat protein